MIKTLKNKAWKLFSRYIRLRDCLKTTGTTTHGICITCGERKNFELLDAGHFISRSWSNTLFNEHNVHAQCKKCNGFHAGMPQEYRRKIIEMYGEGYDEYLEAESKKLHKFTIPELELLIESLKVKIAKLES